MGSSSKGTRVHFLRFRGKARDTLCGIGVTHVGAGEYISNRTREEIECSAGAVDFVTCRPCRVAFARMRLTEERQKRKAS